ncbi:MAG: SRPBCC family protein [Brachybacterium sp.]|uniref:SRPBCC family protein n=1 Tax=Brachybacterium sp. TaxID=1891286 RepID=UPI0026479AB7|nr:SRPBCC family protein [Brachybacterium sp.]MDN5686029.1 SRPBCC family protein [Brachybacterium sp.]
MARTLQVQDSTVIAADPMALYEKIADPSQMGRWSPENMGATVPRPGTPATVGTTFVGSNRRGRARWVTSCSVTEAAPGERFAFDVTAIGPRKPLIKGGIATWTYTFEPVDGGTRVTEMWTDRRTRWPDALAARFDRLVTGGQLFADFQGGNIARTLAALKADVEPTGPDAVPW